MALVESYLEQRPSRSKMAGRLDNFEEILLNIGCAPITKDDARQDVIRPTNAGLLLFGYDPQQFLIQAEVIAIAFNPTAPEKITAWNEAFLSDQSGCCYET